jgi:hypothetical protein
MATSPVPEIQSTASQSSIGGRRRRRPLRNLQFSNLITQQIRGQLSQVLSGHHVDNQLQQEIDNELQAEINDQLSQLYEEEQEEENDDDNEDGDDEGEEDHVEGDEDSQTRSLTEPSENDEYFALEDEENPVTLGNGEERMNLNMEPSSEDQRTVDVSDDDGDEHSFVTAEVSLGSGHDSDRRDVQMNDDRAARGNHNDEGVEVDTAPSSSPSTLSTSHRFLEISGSDEEEQNTPLLTSSAVNQSSRSNNDRSATNTEPSDTSPRSASIFQLLNRLSFSLFSSQPSRVANLRLPDTSDGIVREFW